MEGAHRSGGDLEAGGDTLQVFTTLANLITQAQPGEGTQEGAAGVAHDTPGTDAFDAGPGPKRQRLEGPPGGGHAHDVQPLGAAPSAEDTLALALQQHHQQQAELAAAAAAAAAAQHIQQYGDRAEAGGAALAGLQHAGHGHGHHAPGGDGELSNVMLAQQQLMAAQMQQEQALMAHMQHMQEHLHIQEQDMQYITAAAAAQGLIPPHLHYGHLAAVGEDPTAAAAGGTDDPAATAAAAASAAAALEQQAQHQLAAQQAEQGGQVAAQQLPLQLTAADLPQLAFDPAAIAAATAAGTAVTIPLSVLEGLTPEQIQMLSTGNGFSLVAPPPGGLSVAAAQQADPSVQYKNWWDEEHEKELLELVNNREYCKAVLGCDELDWSLLERHFNRSQNALRKKYWMLSKAQQAAGAAAAAGPKPRAERKNWTDVEAAELLRLAQDAQYLRETLGVEELDWERLAAHFKTTVATTKRKYRHMLEQQQQQQLAAQHALPQQALAALQQQGFVPAAASAPAGGEKGKRQHHRKNVPYRWMIVSALSGLENMEATALEIFRKIEANPNFIDQLDTRIMPGTKHVPRWKIQVRKVLSSDQIFVNTGRKHKHETIWRLNSTALQEGPAERQRQRAGIQPIPLPNGPEGLDSSVGGSAAAAAAAAAAGPAPDAEHAQHTQQAQQLEQHADLAAEHADLGMLHEQLQQHLAAQQAAAAAASGAGLGVGVEHLLGTGAEAAAAAGMAHHHHAHHAGAEHAQQDGGVAVAISAEQLLQLQEAQSLGFSPEQLQVMLPPEHLLHLQQLAASQGHMGHIQPDSLGLAHHLAAEHEQHAALLAAQHGGEPLAHGLGAAAHAAREMEAEAQRQHAEQLLAAQHAQHEQLQHVLATHGVEPEGHPHHLIPLQQAPGDGHASPPL